MSARLEVTREDVRLLFALGALASHVPDRKRAAHLAARAEALALRMHEALTDNTNEGERDAGISAK